MRAMGVVTLGVSLSAMTASAKKKKFRMKHVNESSAKQSRDKKKNYIKVTDPLPPLHHW